MINELIRFRESILSWGMEIPRAFHPKINGNAMKGKGIRVLFSELGIEGIVEFPEYPQMYFYKENKFRSTPTFKFSNDKTDVKNLSGSCARALAMVSEVAKLIEEADTNNEHLLRFVRLAKCIEKGLLLVSPEGEQPTDQLDVGQFVTKIFEYLDSKEIVGPVYICLDLLDESIQTIEFIQALSDLLYELERDAGGERDDLGRSLLGFEPVVPEIKVSSSIGTFPLYCRNKANRCLQRFGLNSTDACHIGSQTRSELSDLVQFILHSDRQSTLEKEGIWYRFTTGKATDSGKREYLVLTSLWPFDQLLEYGKKDADAEDWEASMRAMVGLMRMPATVFDGQSPGMVFDGQFGHIIVIRMLKGAWKVVMSAQKDVAEIADAAESWIEGTCNGHLRRKVYPLSLVGVIFQMNNLWKMDGSKDVSKAFDIQDAYNLFFGNAATVARMSQVFAIRMVPMLLHWTGLDMQQIGQTEKSGVKVPFDICLLGPLQNLILHKLGHIYDREENAMNHWAYYLGQLLQEANSLYYKWFTNRGFAVPERIGQRFVRTAYQSPRAAYHNFIPAFAATYAWCEEHGVYLLRYRELVTKLTESLNGEELPVIPNYQERMLICAGYMNIPTYKKRDPDKEETAEATEPATANS